MAKMNITSCPAEIQFMILQLCQPYDFESLALSCKTLCATAQPLIKQHNKRRKFRSIQFSGDHRHGKRPNEMGTVQELLAKIAVDPMIARYIVHLDLAHRNDLDRHEGALDRFNEAEDALSELISESSYLKELRGGVDDTDMWIEHMRDQGDGFAEPVDFAVAFLLTLLPNLQSLTLSSHWNADTVDFVSSSNQDSAHDDWSLRVRDLIQLIVKRANDESLQDQSLSKLDTLHPTYDVDTQFGVDMLSIVPFLALNSMRNVQHESGFCQLTGPEESEHGSEGNENAEDDDDDDDDEGAEGQGLNEDGDGNGEDQNQDTDMNEDEEDEDEENSDQDENANQDNGNNWTSGYSHSHDDQYFSERYPVLGKNIESLDLHDYVMNSLECAVLLRHMHNLKTLNFNYSMKDEYGYQWAIDAFVDSIMYTVGPHLETLSLTTGQVDKDSELLRSSLHGFKVLKHLELCTILFVNGDGSVGINWGNPDDDWSDGNVPIEPLVDILPPSLETFTLHVPCVDYGCLVELCKGFQKKRAKALPNLNKVKLVVTRRDCWGSLFPNYERQEKIIELLAEEYEFDVEIPERLNEIKQTPSASE